MISKPKQEPDKKGKISKTSFWMVALGLALTLAGPIILFFEKESHAGWAAMFAGLIFMAASRFDDVQEIALAPFSMKLFERRVDKVEYSLIDVRRLARVSSRLSLAAIQFSNRWGGIDERYKESLFLDTHRMLQELQIPEDEIEDVERLWHNSVEFDYAHWVLDFGRSDIDLSEKQ